jgi:hypothetical protein
MRKGLLIGIVLLGAVLIWIGPYAGHSNRIARERIEVACRDFKPGQAYDFRAIEARARREEFRIVVSDAGMAQGRPVPAEIWIGTSSMTAKWWCVVQHAEGKVLSARVRGGGSIVD